MSRFKQIISFIAGFIAGASIVWLLGVVPIGRQQELDLRLLDGQLREIEVKTEELISLFETKLEIDYWSRR